jgi:hypothetical protein
MTAGSWASTRPGAHSPGSASAARTSRRAGVLVRPTARRYLDRGWLAVAGHGSPGQASVCARSSPWIGLLHVSQPVRVCRAAGGRPRALGHPPGRPRRRPRKTDPGARCHWVISPYRPAVNSRAASRPFPGGNPGGDQALQLPVDAVVGGPDGGGDRGLVGGQCAGLHQYPAADPPLRGATRVYYRAEARRSSSSPAWPDKTR